MTGRPSKALPAAFVLLSAVLPAAGVEVVVDNTDAGFSVLSQTWGVNGAAGQYGTSYRYKLTNDTPSGEVQWQPALPTAGPYEVFVWYYSTGAGRPTNARYTVHHAAGSSDVLVNQQINGSSWFSLGTFSFPAGTGGRVTLTSQAEAGKTIAADAVRFLGACSPRMLSDFEGYADNLEVLFNNPRFSLSTSSHLAAAPDLAAVSHEVEGSTGPACYQLSWQFVDAALNRWVRITTFNADQVPNPTIAFDRPVRLHLRMDGPAGASLCVSMGVRETGTSAGIGEDGGTSGTIEWVGAGSTISGSPQGKALSALPGVWQTLVFDPLRDPVAAFTGNGLLSSATGKGTLEHLAFASTGQAGPFTIYLDGIEQLCESPPRQPCDFDTDSDVDGVDFSLFEACMTGSNSGPPWPACLPADIDRDGDVDVTDFGYFQLCLSGDGIAASPFCAAAANTIPPRPPGAISGSAFKDLVLSTPAATREQMVLAEMAGGNIPDFLRAFVPITVNMTLSGAPHTATYYAMPDVLAIGSDADYFRMPMGPRTAQAIGDVFGCIMPTRRMVDQIYAASAVKLAPVPFTPDATMTTVPVFWQSHLAIENQRAAAGAPVGSFLGGIKKDVVITAQLAANPGKVAIYGWHQLSGQPIQPLYLGHEITYMDYSHGIRLVKQIMLVDGQQRFVTDILADPVLNALISDEGAVTDPRYH